MLPGLIIFNGRTQMAYFRENDMEKTRRQAPVEPDDSKQEEYTGSDYDDGFDDPFPEEEPLTEEEKQEIRLDRFRMASGAGNLFAVITGAVAILLLLALLFNMISFVLNDADRNFTLFQTRL